MPEKTNLSDLTVFLITVGAPSYEDCRKALSAQDCTFRLEEIRDVAPMSAAFQQMIDRCKTRYYIQVDEDMILKPHAVRTLREHMSGLTAQSKAQACYPLWDEHLGRTILGIKIYDHTIMRQHPYRNVLSCEVDQLKRVKAAGYGIDIEWGRPWPQHWGMLKRGEPTVLGIHGAHYTPRSAFERYKDLFQKYRSVGGIDWVAIQMSTLLGRLAKGHDNAAENVDLWAVIGAAAGLTTKTSGLGEKDFRSYATMSDFGVIRSVVTGPPLHLDIHTSQDCNLECEFCRRQRFEAPKHTEFTPELAKKVLDKFPSIRSACVAGFGEPLIPIRIGELVNTLLDAGLVVGFITNGLLVRTKFHAIRWADLAYINVSLNEVDPVRYRKLAGVDAFEQAFDGFKLLRNRGMKVGLSFVVDAERWQRIPAFLDFAAKEKAHFVSIVNVLPHHDVSKPSENKAFWQRVITDENVEFAEALPGLRKKAQSLGVNVNAWPVPISRSHCPRLCRSPFVALGVNGNGVLSGCNRVEPPRGENGAAGMGDMAWRNPQFVALRKALAGDGDLPVRCTMCFGNWKRE